MLILSKSQQNFIATKCLTITSTMYWEQWQQEQYWWSVVFRRAFPLMAR